MIKKTSDNLMNWIYKHVIDFTDENDKSGLSWNSTNKEALRFISRIPRKERVQKYGIYSSKTHLLAVTEFDDIKEGLEKGYLSEDVCKLIFRWNKQVGRENWDMADVRAILYPALGRHVHRNFLYTTIKQLVDYGVMECINPKEEHGKLYRLTEKGERVLEID